MVLPHAKRREVAARREHGAMSGPTQRATGARLAGCLSIAMWLLAVIVAIIGVWYDSASAVGGALLVYLLWVSR